MVGQISFKKSWSQACRSFTLLILFIFLPVVVFLFCFVVGFLICWEVGKTKKINLSLQKLRPQVGKKSLCSISIYVLLMILYVFLVIFYVILRFTLYTSASLLISVVFYVVALPAFYLYSVVIFFRKIIVWGGSVKFLTFKPPEQQNSTNLDNSIAN